MTRTVLSYLLISGAAMALDNISQPFKLIIQSADRSINGTSLSACDIGLDNTKKSLCVYKAAGDQFFTNTSGPISPVKGYERYATLLWNRGDDPKSYPMKFYFEQSTNVALPLFTSDYTTQYVTIDTNNSISIVGYLDDTRNPPTGAFYQILKNWYVCTTYYDGFVAQSLGWVLGSGAPHNPSCVEVEIQRKYV